MSKEITKSQKSGWTILFSNVAFMLISIAIFIYGIVMLSRWHTDGGGFVLALGIILFLISNCTKCPSTN